MTDTYSEIGNPKPWIRKDPDAILDYSFDWETEDWLAAGESVSSYVVTVDGVTLSTHSRTGGIVTAWVSGGTVGEVASITCQITTDSVPARTDQRTVYLKIRER